MIEAVVLHQSLKNLDHQWHTVGYLADPEAWAQKAANTYSRPVGLRYPDGGVRVFYPVIEAEFTQHDICCPPSAPPKTLGSVST